MCTGIPYSAAECARTSAKCTFSGCSFCDADAYFSETGSHDTEPVQWPRSPEGTYRTKSQPPSEECLDACLPVQWASTDQGWLRTRMLFQWASTAP